MSQPSFLEIPRVRADAIHRIADALKGVTTVAVTTHINADGDAAGSVAAMARLLPQLGLKPIIVNPTPWPAVFAFLKKGLDDRTSGGEPAALTRPRCAPPTPGPGASGCAAEAPRPRKILFAPD